MPKTSPTTTGRKRQLRARPLYTGAPISFVDEDASCFPVTGFVARRVRAIGDRLAIPFFKDGKRRVYLVADWSDAIAGAAVVPGDASSDENVANDGADSAPATPANADGVLRSLGLERRRAG